MHAYAFRLLATSLFLNGVFLSAQQSALLSSSVVSGARTVETVSTGGTRVSTPSSVPPSTVVAATLSGLQIPAANQCQSTYDSFYEAEPGVYGYWALCESSSSTVGYDYLGQWSFVNGFGNNSSIQTRQNGPVSDFESAAGVLDANVRLASQGMSLNKNAGTVAAWINADATAYPVSAVSFSGINSPANLAIQVSRGNGLCFTGLLTNSAGTAFRATQCGFSPSSWHRVLLTWTSGSLTLYVDGTMTKFMTYTGALSDDIYYYQLFPGCCSTGKPMSLAKVLISNQAWGGAQATQDNAPNPVTPPLGGVFVTAQQLGKIHQDVMGVADNNQDISTAARVQAVQKGLQQAGIKSIRYAGGFGGISADAGDWHNGQVECTQSGNKASAQNLSTGNNLDAYEKSVSQPLALHMGYTVNYGSNAPLCTAGGDPVANGADLVRYANVTKGYGIHYWEIGNEQFAYGGSAIDLHPNPYLSNSGNSPTSYTQYEPAFYNAMKAVDPTIQVGVPVSGPGTYNAELNFGYPVLSKAAYDAVIFHPYPVHDPISDGNTLYPERVASTSLNVRGILLAYQTLLLNFKKPADALWLTEWDGEYQGSTWSHQTIGAVTPLFTVMQLAEFMQAGVPYATWWAQGMTDNCSTFNYDYTGQGTYAWFNCGTNALTYSGFNANGGEMATGMQPGDLFPAGRGFQLLSQSGFVMEGEHMLRTQSDPVTAPWLASYAATHGTDSAVILVNRDPFLPHVIPVQFAQRQAGASVDQWTYGKPQYDMVALGNWSQTPVHNTLGRWQNLLYVTLPPWSASVLIVH